MDKNRKYKIMLAVMLGVIVALLCVAFFLLGVSYGKKHATVKETADNMPRSTVVNRDNIDSVSERENRGKAGRQGPVSYEVIMNTEWEFDDDGRIASNAYVENSRDNNNAVRFTVAHEDDPDNILYESDTIKVGESITGIEFDKTVKKGRSKAIVTYKLLDDEGNSVGDVKAGVTLVYGK